MDASTAAVSALTSHHVFRGVEERIKWSAAASGLQVIVGVKGSGKTDLRRYLEAQGDVLVLNLDADHAYLGLDAAKVGESSGRVKNAIATILLREFAGRITESNGASTGMIKSLRGALARLPAALDLNLLGVTVRLGDLLKPEAAPVLQVAVDTLVESVVEALGDQRGAIMIDDVDDVFAGITQNPLFLEGVARAVKDINRQGGNRIHVLLFVKYGLWRSWYESQREYDRVKDVIGFLVWNHESLVELIAKRIAHRHGLDGQGAGVAELWDREFDWTGELNDFARLLTRHCVSGPRDMVELCNRAAQLAGDKPIDSTHIEACLGGYSADKIFALNADWGDTYPSISQFVERVCQGAPTTMTGRELAHRVESRTILEPSFDDFRRYQWYAHATKERLTRIMYEAGVVGYQSPHGIVYSLEDPNLSMADLLTKDHVSIHPAFRPQLGIGLDDTTSTG